MRAQTSE
jgi:centrosomal protein CEP41